MKNRTFRKIIQCNDSKERACKAILSVRGKQLAIKIHGGDEMAHMTFEQAAKFHDNLLAAMDLILERLGPQD